MRMTIESIPNRVVIAALDAALNRIDREMRGHPISTLKEERDAIQCARNFIADKRKVF